MSAKNYITPAGAKKLQEEYEELRYKERPEVTKVVEWAASLGDRSENADYQYGKKRLREIDKRLEFLTRQMEAMEVVDPESVHSDKVLFGATVTVVDEDDRQRVFSIVGVDEVDPSNGRISWKSPLGAALLNSSEGDWVEYKTPKGKLGVEVLNIAYQPIV